MKITLAPIATRASGRFGGLVASNWRGVDLVRRFTRPSNPNTIDQQEIRRIFINSNIAFATMTTNIKASWTNYAKGKKFINRNAFIGQVVKHQQGEPALGGTPLIKGDSSTIPPALMVVTHQANQLTIVLTAPELPTDWTITKAIATVVPNKDWGGIRTYAELKFSEGTDLTSPYSIVISGLTPAVEYEVEGYLLWHLPDETERYSPSLITQSTPDAP